MVEGALEVAENALHNREMELMMVGHVEAHLLNWIGDVRPDEGEVLESSNQTTIGNQIPGRGSHVRGDLGLSIDRHGAWLAIAYASSLKDIPSVLTLLQEDVIMLLLH
jgi:hypothetical protein